MDSDCVPLRLLREKPESVEVGQCAIENPALSVLFLEELASNTSVRWLLLSECCAEDGSEQVPTTLLADCLRRNRTLTSLSFCTSGLTAHGARLLTEALGVSNVSSVHIEDNWVKDEGVSLFAPLLSRLQSLELIDVGMTAVGAAAIAGGLNAPDCCITSLSLARNCISDVGASVLAEALLHCSSLKELDLSGNELHMEGFKALAQMLVSNWCLQSLELNKCGMDDQGAVAIAEALAINSSLKTIEMESSEVTSVGACALARALKSNNSLLAFEFAFNQIAPRGTTAVVDALSANQTLRRCSFSCSGADAAASMVRNNHTLRSLQLDGLSNAEGGIICEALMHNFALVSFSGNLGDSMDKILAQRERARKNYAGFRACSAAVFATILCFKSLGPKWKDVAVLLGRHVYSSRGTEEWVNNTALVSTDE